MGERRALECLFDFVGAGRFELPPAQPQPVPRDERRLAGLQAARLDWRRQEETGNDSWLGNRWVTARGDGLRRPVAREAREAAPRSPMAVAPSSPIRTARR